MNIEKFTSPESQSALAERASKKLLHKMEKEGLLKQFPGIYVKHVGDNVLASGREGNVTVYDRFNEQGESQMIFNLIDIREGVFFDKAAFLAGFREVAKKSESGKVVYELFRISDIEMKSGMPIPGKKSIDPFSMEYFQAWKNIDFFADKISLESWKKPSIEGKLVPMEKETLHVLLQSGSVRIKDLVTLLEQKQIDSKSFKEAYPHCLSQLLGQIGDKRFERMNDSVKEEELEEYKRRGYLTQSTHEILMKKLKMVK